MHPCFRSSVQIKHANRRIVYPFRLFPVISGGFAVRTLFACRIGKIKRPAAIVSVPGAGRNNPLGTFVSLLKPKTQSYADATLFPRRRFPRTGMKGSAIPCPESRSLCLARFGLLNPVRLPRPCPGESTDAARPALAALCSRRLCAAQQAGRLRRAVNGANAPASNAPETGGSKVVPGGPRNSQPGASRTLPGDLALRGCPVRRAPCGRTTNHPPLPSVAGDSGLPMSATSADGFRRCARSLVRNSGYRRCSFSLSLNSGRDDRG